MRRRGNNYRRKNNGKYGARIGLRMSVIEWLLKNVVKKSIISLIKYISIS